MGGTLSKTEIKGFTSKFTVLTCSLVSDNVARNVGVQQSKCLALMSITYLVGFGFQGFHEAARALG